MPPIPSFAFIDFEASSLEKGGWPIELGWAIVNDDHTINSGSVLIQPSPDWDMAYWSKESQRVHGISLEQLMRKGLKADDVVKMAMNILSGKELLSDAPEYDQYWLDCLFKTCNLPAKTLRVKYVSHAFDTPQVDELAFDRGERRLLRNRKHRAHQDALDWAELYLSSRK